MSPLAQPPYQDADPNSRHIHSAAPSIGSPPSGSAHPTTKHTSIAEQREKHIVNRCVPNIVIYGETGVGKSSIINLIAGQKIAHTSNDALGCTVQHKQYIVSLDGMPCTLWDTTGLDEGTEGTVPARVAESNLRSLIQDLAHTGGIHLIVYCIRGTRPSKALKRNYDLFYVTFFRKKVPVALVVTGLERQQGEMETWWNKNEAVLRRYGMWFDAHACVTTLDVDHRVIQQRRSDSQKLLRELVVRYSRLPAWKAEPSLISQVLPLFRTALHKTSSTSQAGNTTSKRKVIVCDMAEDVPVEFSPGITVVWEKFTAQIGEEQYEFVRMNKHALQSPTTGTLADIGGVDAGVLVFYTSTLLSSHIPPTDVDALKSFYDIADGQMRPVIVVLRGCDDEVVAQRCWADVASRHSNIQAYFVPFPSAVDGRPDTQAKLGEMIQGLCIEHVEVKFPRLNIKYIAGKRLLAAMVKRVGAR
ncbi:hypothetical protein J3R82DRAFT_8001 [Butyriboletus roseoflavus]|nr:hypothetical protein J3R82DRAFT_8001 [Butyriboletus roseoflavus]